MLVTPTSPISHDTILFPYLFDIKNVSRATRYFFPKALRYGIGNNIIKAPKLRVLDIVVCFATGLVVVRP